MDGIRKEGLDFSRRERKSEGRVNIVRNVVRSVLKKRAVSPRAYVRPYASRVPWSWV